MLRLRHRSFPITVHIRWTPDVPMVVPEINPEHMHVIEYQKETGNHQRICGSKAKLLYSVLRTGTDGMERI